MMGKIKLNLVSGAVVEKPLISAFKANNNSYVVLDNEMNGSMGLPIILVCKLENNRLIKIVDQGEWQIVKEYLKNIIAGNQIEFIKVNNEIAADDIYYTQLTLPVPSFDALRNAYKLEEESSDATILDINPEPVANVSEQVAAGPVAPQVDTTIASPNPVVDVGVPSVPVVNNPDVNMTAPAIDLNIPIPTFGEPINANPAVENVARVEPVVPQVDVPMVETTPVVEPIPAIEPAASNEVDMFKEQKEAFMQACENMFDALVQKFQKELENRK